MPSTQVLRDHTSPVGKEPMEIGSPPLITGIPSEEAIDSYEVMGTAVMVTWLLHHHTTREVFIDIQFCSKAFVDLGIDPMIVDHLTLILQELSDSDN